MFHVFPILMPWAEGSRRAYRAGRGVRPPTCPTSRKVPVGAVGGVADGPVELGGLLRHRLRGAG